MKQTTPVFLTITGWLHTLFLFSCLFPLVTVPIGLSDKDAAGFTASCVLLLLPVIVSWYTALKLSSLALYLLCSVVATLLFGAAGRIVGNVSGAGIWGGIFYLALSLIIFLIRAGTRIQKGRLKKEFQEMPLSAIAQMSEDDLVVTCPLDVPHPTHWLFFAACYLAGALLKISLCWHMAFYLCLGDIFLYVLYHFSDSFYRFLQEHSRSANLPVRTMTRIVRIIFSIAVVVLFLFALPSIFYGNEPLSTWTPKEHTPAPVAIEPPAPVAETTVTEESMLAAFDTGEPWTPPRWLTFLANAFLYLICIGIGLGILWYIYSACRRAGDFFASGTEDEIAFIEKVFSDESISLRKKRGQMAGEGSENVKIRRLYKKTIRRVSAKRPRTATAEGRTALQPASAARRMQPDRTHTPAELEESAGLMPGEARELLHRYYEKARYGEEGCTAQEAAEVKKAAAVLEKT